MRISDWNSDVCSSDLLEEARNIFDGLRSPRKDLLGQLLSCCTSVKAVRLFLTWARETSLVDVDALLERYPVRTGSNTRWMSRLDDGTLLSLSRSDEHTSELQSLMRISYAGFCLKKK